MVMASAAVGRQRRLSIRTRRGETDGGRLSVAINEARPSLICLLQKLMPDLASAPRLCSQNISGREAREKGIKTMNPFSQGHFPDRYFVKLPTG